MTRTLLAIVLVAALALSACDGSHTDGVRSIAGSWAFHPGDDTSWASATFNDSAWTHLQVPGSWGRQGHQDVSGIAWYRLRVSPTWPTDQPLGVTIGKVHAAYELYADGVKVGGVGQLPPNPEQVYDRHATYIIPFSTPRQSITLALRVWRPEHRHPGEAGPTGGPFEIGPLATLLERAKLLEVDRLVFFCVFMAVAIYLLGLWLLRPKSKEYGYFAVVALCAATYVFLLTQWKYTLTSDFVFLKKTEHMMLYVTPIFLTEFLGEFLGRPRNLWVRIAETAFAIGGLAVLLSPGLEFALRLLPFLEGYSFICGMVALAMLGWWWHKGDRNAGVVGSGVLAMVIAMTHDAFVDRGLIVGPRFAAYGFVAMVTGLALLLGVRFHRAVEGIANMSRELEGRVKQRTAELADAYSRMEELALRDPLTNLLNRRAITERASAGLSLAHRRKAAYSVALIDIDHFKAINDTHGHDAGDRVLVAVAEALGMSARVSDDVARWGGEEFLVLLPDADQAASLLAGERLRAAIASMIIGANALRVAATVSVGVATSDGLPEKTTLFEELVRRSDEALYRAKESGRNRVSAA